MKELDYRTEISKMVKELRSAGYGNDELKRHMELRTCTDFCGNLLHVTLDLDQDGCVSWKDSDDLVNHLCFNCGYDKETIKLAVSPDEYDGTITIFAKYETKATDSAWYQKLLQTYIEHKKDKQQDTTVQELTNLLGFKILPYHVAKIREIVRNRE